MINELRDAASFAGINILGIAVSLSSVEQGVRILTGIAVLVYSIFKAAGMVRAYRNGQKEP
jgi:hypothetical protein